jgi:uncharacterized protein YutE (UPF0331/DUF86 family)
MDDLNPSYLLEQFRLIEEYLRRARGIAARPREEYLQDPNLVDASVRQLTVLFETCHNVAKHLIARFDWRPPNTKAEAFEILCEHGVVTENLQDAFRSAARFRNLVTYQTAIVQDDIVYRILQEHLTDFESFLASVAQWLEEQSLSLLDDDDLLRAAESRMPEPLASRLEELNWQRQATGLDEREEEEASRLVRLYEHTLLVRATAAKLLKERGRDLPPINLAG